MVNNQKKRQKKRRSPSLSGTPINGRSKALALLLFTSQLLLDCAASKTIEKPVTILFWNLQNAFDDRSDGGEYREFDPQQGWNTTLFQQRLNNYASVLNHYQHADVLAFAEIENRYVLEQIQRKLNRHYSYLFLLDSPGIDLGLLSDFPILEGRSIDVGWWNSVKLRPIISLSLDVRGSPLVLFLNHWKSKLGGAQATEPARRQSSQKLISALQPLLAQAADTDVIVIGDFNENHDEFQRIGQQYLTALIPWGQGPPSPPAPQLWLSGQPEDLGQHQGGITLFSPWIGHQQSGSYFYADRWHTIDQFLLAPSLFDQKNFDYTSMEVLRPPQMSDRHNRPQPWRTKQRRGYSDHFPITLRLSQQ